MATKKIVISPNNKKAMAFFDEMTKKKEAFFDKIVSLSPAAKTNDKTENKQQ